MPHDAAPEPAQPLFRQQVLQARQAEWMGPVLLRPRTMHRWFGAFAALSAGAIILCLFTASYTKKVRVGGWLVPEQGLVRVVAPRSGVATRLLVREGDNVRRGQPLLALSAEERSAALGDTQAGLARELRAQRDSIDARRLRNRRLYEQQRASLAERIGAAQAEQRHMAQQIELQRSRVALARQAETRAASLARQGFFSEQQVQGAIGARLDQEGRLRELQRELFTLRRETAALQGQLGELPLAEADRDAQAGRDAAELGREMAEVESRREQLVVAPVAGTVTAVQAYPGSAVAPGVPLLSIVPGNRLEAHLYASSRAIGFARPGQQVLMRYQAYPYQKFGHYTGSIRSVSRTGIAPAELPPQFAGTGTQALYRITVELQRQSVTAYGDSLPLQSGMQLDADILLERRTLLEWVLDPIYTLTRR